MITLGSLVRGGQISDDRHGRTDQIDPAALRFQDDLDDFADCAVSSVRSGDQMSCVLDFGGSIGRAGCQANSSNAGKSGRSSPTIADLAG